MAAPLLDSIIDDQQGAIILLDLAVLAALAAEGQQMAIDQAVAVMVDQTLREADLFSLASDAQ